MKKKNFGWKKTLAYSEGSQEGYLIDCEAKIEKEIAHRGWVNFGYPSAVVAFAIPIKENITNTYNLVGHVSHVRQRPVLFRNDTINAHYGFPDMAEKSEYVGFLRGNIDYDEVLGFLIDDAILNEVASWETHNREQNNF
ncbi:hypothetical protein ACH5RR_002716 [Cinchona calisaya]|uniref:Uncharacterized protein n=1 Tax=Cinchona calisaya TaxID=153742 RepID=A0ABD3ASS4_9GENT